MRRRVVGAAILMAWFIAAVSAGMLGARIEWVLESSSISVSRVSNDRDVWFNPRWTKTHEARPWIWGSRSYTTRDLMGRSI